MTAQLSLFQWFGSRLEPEVRKVRVRSHDRVVPGAAPTRPRRVTKATSAAATGKEMRDYALAAQERRYGDWLAYARLVAVSHAGEHGTVSADDIAHLPLPKGASPNVRGPVFNHHWFEFVGFTRSKRPEAHHNRINVYALSASGRHIEDSDA